MRNRREKRGEIESLKGIKKVSSFNNGFFHFYDFYLCWQLMERDGDWKLLSFVRFDWLGPSSDTATFFFTIIHCAESFYTQWLRSRPIRLWDVTYGMAWDLRDCLNKLRLLSHANYANLIRLRGQILWWMGMISFSLVFMILFFICLFILSFLS